LQHPDLAEVFYVKYAGHDAMSHHVRMTNMLANTSYKLWKYPSILVTVDIVTF